MWLNIESRSAVHGWLQDYGAPGNVQMLTTLVPYLFTILEALYKETRKLPVPVPFGGLTEGTIDVPNRFSFGLWLEAEDYVTVRAILALSGDLIYVLQQIQGLKGLNELGPVITSMLEEARKFEDARDFFTHMDERWRNLAKHGVDGPFNIAKKAHFTPNAKNQVYLIWNDDTIYFSHFKEQKAVRLTRQEFENIFDHARKLLTALGNNRESMNQKDKIPVENYFPKNS